MGVGTGDGARCVDKVRGWVWPARADCGRAGGALPCMSASLVSRSNPSPPRLYGIQSIAKTELSSR